jgi:hypothetical protein
VCVFVCVSIATRYRVSCSSTSRGLCIMFHSFAFCLEEEEVYIYQG